MMEAWLLAQQAEMEAIKAEIIGMAALNQYRISREETIAYNDESFQKKATEFRSIATSIIRNSGPHPPGAKNSKGR